MFFCRSLAVYLLLLISSGSVSAVKVGLMYNGKISEFSWNYRIELARANLQDNVYPGNITAVYKESVLDPNEMANLTEGWLAEDYDMVLGTSWEYQETLTNISAQVLAQGGKTKFAVFTGWQASDNLALANSKLYQGKYLAGYLAGLMTKSAKACYVAAVRDDTGLVSAITATALGFREANPNGHIWVHFIGTWANSSLELAAAQQCVQDNPDTDMFFTHTDTTSVQQWVQDSTDMTRYSFGMSSDMRLLVGETVLTSVIFKWETIMRDLVEQAVDGNFVQNNSLFYGLKEGGIDIASYSYYVPPDIAKLVNERKYNMTNFDEYDAFCGEQISKYTSTPLDDNGCINATYVQEVFGTVDTFPPELITVGANTTLPPIPVVWLNYGDGISIAFMIIAGLGIFACFALILLILFWDNPHFTASSKDFLIIICIGTMIGLAAVFLIPGEPDAGQCQAFMWLCGTGFILVYGSVLVKNVRIWIIFHRADALQKTPKIPFWLLFSGVLVMLLCDYVILIVWTSIDYPTVVLVESPLYPGELVSQCYWVHYTAWMGAFLGYKGLLVVCGSVLGWLARKIHVEMFNESKQLGLMMYNLLAIGTILVSLLQTIALNLEATFALQAVLLTWIGISGLGILFAPKIYNNIRGKQKGTNVTSRTRGPASNTNNT